MKSQHILIAITLTISIVIEAWVRVISVWVIGTDGFALWPPIDNIMHFLWGMNLFFLFVVVFKWKPRDAFFAIIFWHMIWEMIEMVGDSLLSQPEHMLDHFFLDGIKDTIVAISGGGLGWLLVRDYKLPLRDTRYLSWMQLYALCVLPLPFVGGFFYLLNIREGLAQPSPNGLSIIWISVAIIVSLLWAYMKKKRYGLYRD